MKREEKRVMDRRSFLKGSALVGGSAVVAGLTGCASGSESSGGQAAGAESWMPETWDETTDVVVIGYGGAGGCAAIAANEAGVGVIVLEKSPIPDGGNTGCSSGSIHTAPFADTEEWIEKIVHGCFGTVDEETIRAMVAHSEPTPDWLASVGIDIEWSDAPASASRPASRTGKIVGFENNEGRFMWEAIHTVVQDLGIDVRLETPAIELIQNPATKEIIGVKAQTPEGEDLYIKALRGVVMAMGGYENNPWKQIQYNQPGVRLRPWGTPYNTGDGIDMACCVGAQLWHLHGLEWSSVNFRLASEEVGCSVSTDATAGITPYNHIFVNQLGQRFMNEAKSMNHDIESKPVIDFNQRGNDFVNLPFFMVFDSTMFNEKPLYIGSGRSGIINTYAGVQELCDWGPDNSKALANGWIFQGETLEELASKMKGKNPSNIEVGCDAAGLAATVAAYNEYVAAGNDGAFGRAVDKMAPIVTPPFYAIEMGLSCINTQGGAVRNGDCQVIDVANNPIPRLYSAGEFGSINGYVYVYGNIYEAFVTGRVTGVNAAALEPWE